METVLVGASMGAILAYGLLSQRKVWEEKTRQREAELFARRLRAAVKP
jgi:hypothetical protein